MNKKSLVLIFGVLLLINFVFADANVTCIDTDGGKNYFQRGLVRIVNAEGGAYYPISKITGSNRETCTSNMTLLETYCNNNEYAEEEYTCTEGCVESACLKCKSIGFRKNGYYCSEEGDYKLQRMVDENGNWAKCENHYECESNVCIEGECVHSSFIRRAIDWIKNWFN